MTSIMNICTVTFVSNEINVHTALEVCVIAFYEATKEQWCREISAVEKTKMYGCINMIIILLSTKPEYP